MLYKIEPTGKSNEDGCVGIFSRAEIHRIGKHCLLLGEGTELSDIENETIELVEAETELYEKYKDLIDSIINAPPADPDPEEPQ